MSALRTLFGILVLAAILYAVYVSITRNPKNNPPPPAEVANGLVPPPPSDLLMQATPQFSMNPSGSGTAPAQSAAAGWPNSGTAFPALGTPPAGGTGGPQMNISLPGTAAAPNPPGSFAPAPQSLPGYAPTSAAPSSPLSNSALAPPPCTSAMTPAAPSYPSTGLPEVPGTGVAPAALIDTMPKPSNAPPGAGLPHNLGDSLSPSGVSPSPSTTGHPEFAALLQTVYTNLAQGHFAESHAVLSRFYAEPRLTAEESRTLTELLDQLAGTVIYSRHHLLEQPYKVQPDDTLERIARNYEISPSLLSKINGIRDSRQLQPGMELKVLHGPMDAVIDLNRYEMTLFLKDRYAGRFAIGVGRDHPQLEGQYTVRDKQYSPVYFGPDRVMAPSDPSYPLGKRWIDLGNQIGIHGTNDPRNIGHTEGRGSIFLSDRDIDDVYDILTVGSKIAIHR